MDVEIFEDSQGKGEKKKRVYSTDNISDIKCMGIFPKTHSGLQLGVLQFNYDTNYLELAQAPKVKDSVTHTHTHKQVVGPTLLSNSATNKRFPKSLLSFSNLL